MQNRIVSLSLLVASSWAIAQSRNPAAGGPSPSHLGARSRTAFSQTLPRLNGSHLEITTVEVTYAPGNFSAPHSHPCPVIGYVIRGAVRMQVKGGQESIYKAGDSFYEAPNGIHLVSANASSTEPATFLATFICDHSAPLSIEMPESKRREPAKHE